MNHARVAALLREQARIAVELAEEFAPSEPGDAPAVTVPPPKPRARSFPAPMREPSEIDKARANKMLRRRGIHT